MLHRRTLRRQQPRHYPIFVCLSVSSHFLISTPPKVSDSYLGGNLCDTGGDVWGATDSWQHRFHLQSYFLAFGPKAFGHEAFGVFWRSIRNVRSKAWVVSRYEMGLSRALINAGLRCKAIWSYAEMIKVLRKTVAEHDSRDST